MIMIMMIVLALVLRWRVRYREIFYHHPTTLTPPVSVPRGALSRFSHGEYSSVNAAEGLMKSSNLC